MNERTRLSSKAWAFHDYLMDKTLGNSQTVSQKDAYDYLKSKGFDLAWNESQNQHNDHCRGLKDLVDEINFSTEPDKLVYQSDYRYCIANEEQADEIREYYHQKAMLALERESVIAKKCRRDGQGKLVNNAGRELRPENEEFHDTFNRPAPPTSQRLLVTYEIEENGIPYSTCDYMSVPLGLTDDQIDEELAARLGEKKQLKHWEKK